MLNLRRAAALAALLIAGAHLSLAQSEQGGPYVRRGSIGEKKEERPAANSPYSTLPVEQWVNQRFIGSGSIRGESQ